MYIKVHVIPESKEESVTEKADVVYVAVREKAEHGAANRRMLELLRVRYGSSKRLRIVSGHHAPHKIVSVE
ncbi:MAG: DUF167 domain-containing protein [Candidatus Taylorbacteria bacterium]|nr:DUF167 domain-containing protein [Candidatus Taylorbacteria bacterium]